MCVHRSGTPRSIRVVQTLQCVLGMPVFKSVPGDQCGPVHRKKFHHTMRNNLGKISFCCIIKMQNMTFTSLTMGTGSRFHTPSKVTFQLHVSIFHYNWNLFFKFSNLFWFKMFIINPLLVQNSNFLLSMVLYPIFGNVATF